jgi:para-aminobenzoate synthetase component 1
MGALLAGSHMVAGAVAIELPWLEPADAFLALAEDPHLAFLDSAATQDKRAEVSYLCPDPVAALRLGMETPDPFADLQAWIPAGAPRSSPSAGAWPFAFAGGAIGWLGYDLGRAACGLPSRFAPVPGLPGGSFCLYDTVLGFDHRARRAWALAWDRPDSPAAARLVRLAGRLTTAPHHPHPGTAPDWHAEMPRETYEMRLDLLRGYIAAGDIYQANLTVRFAAPRPADFSPVAYHMALRRRSPAPFGAYLGGGDGVAISGASPERFLRLAPDGRVETRPIKGTAARSPDPDEDARAAAALLASPKERAENLMITDLLRNDLSQVCEVGSVAVPELLVLERYAQAHHLVSAVTGRLRAGLGATDLLRAAFPGGSITGAPKRRAMQIIDELEAGPRGAYCGAVVWIGFDGAMDSAIIIRSLVATREMLFAQAGGGITWDSQAGAEYEEMMLKLSALLAASRG